MERFVSRLVGDPVGYAGESTHLPSRVDVPESVMALLDLRASVSRHLPLVWPMRPRARANIDRLGLTGWLQRICMACLPPQAYLEMLGLLSRARQALTDSAGTQEETNALGVPCLTLRSNTERPITVEQGANTLVPRDAERVLVLVDEVLRSGGKRGRTPEYWDGHAASRIAVHLAGCWLTFRATRPAEALA